jgi:ActR/RegA family two-component response regulator
MSAKAAAGKPPRMALLVDADKVVISSLQGALLERGFLTIVARDLPQALSAMTEHYFEIAIVNSQLAKGGDGWPLAGVLHLVFPKAFVCVISPTEPDVLALQAAINYGVKEIYQQSSPALEVVSSIFRQLDGGSGLSRRAN